MKFDVIIIGGGAAGMSAALWCDDLGLSALLLEQKAELGGQLLRVYNPIQNHLGIMAENGKNLRDIFVKQIRDRKFTLKMNSKIQKLDLENKKIRLDTDEEFTAPAIIIATGVSRRKLDIKGEAEFQSKGILTSGKRDKDSVKNKNVVIIGGGDAALENSLILAESAKKITLIHRSSDFRAREEFLKKAKNNPKIEFITDSEVRKFIGEDQISEIKLKNLQTGEISRTPTDAVLIRIGVEPNSQFLSDKLYLDKKGYVNINARCETNIKGVWAIGDVANPVSPTVSSSVGMGATAVKSIYSDLFSD